MTDSTPEQRQRLAELEAMARQQDEKDRRQAIEHVRALIEIQTDREMRRLRPAADASTAQLKLLAGRLQDLGLLDLEDDLDEEIEFGTIASLDTGELIVAIAVGDLTYWEAGTTLIVQRETRGRIEWARVGDDGEPGQWHCAEPPRRRAALN